MFDMGYLLGEDKPKSRVLFCRSGRLNGCSVFRMEYPVMFLKTQGIQALGSPWLDLSVMWLYHLWVLQRPTNHFDLISRLAEKYQVDIVVELDDDPYNIPSWNPASIYYKEEQLEQLTKYIMLAKAVFVSTYSLGLTIEPLNSNFFVLPNSLDHSLYYSEVDPKGEVIIGWHGGMTHLGDLLFLTKGLLNVAKRHPEVRVMFFGFCPELIMEPLAAQLGDRFMFIPGVSIENFYSRLSSLKVDIGLAPLSIAGNAYQFNQCKSNLKILEVWLTGGVPVATWMDYKNRLGPYDLTISQGRTGFKLVNDVILWEGVLEELVTKRDLRIAMAREGWRETVEYNNIWRNGIFWLEAIRKVIDTPVLELTSQEKFDWYLKVVYAQKRGWELMLREMYNNGEYKIEDPEILKWKEKIDNEVQSEKC